ncbi:VWFA domain-containing protein, variant 4 [Balamuthia mandrillaris]
MCQHKCRCRLDILRRLLFGLICRTTPFVFLSMEYYSRTCVKQECFQSVNQWFKCLNNLAPAVPIVLCASKTDEQDNRLVLSKIAAVERACHHSNILCSMRLSAKTCFNIEKPFLTLARSLCGDPSLVFVETPALAPPECQLGFAVGGAGDCKTFREKVDKGIAPSPADVTYEGMFAEYFFDALTVTSSHQQHLFHPKYERAMASDPLTESRETEYFLSVGLGSDMDARDFSRFPLNAVLVLDISGSMACGFYESNSRSKFSIAIEAIISMMAQLRADDNLGIVLFNHQATVLEPISPLNTKSLEKLQSVLLKLSACGGTSMEAGLALATDMMSAWGPSIDAENRIIFLTDALPSQSEELALIRTLETNAMAHIFASVLGVGVDFNTPLVEQLTKVRGANYFSVHNSKDFKQRMEQGFNDMVTPLLFDLQMNFASDVFDLIEVYGSPNYDVCTSTIMKVATLFSSQSNADGHTKGGVILLKLRAKEQRVYETSAHCSLQVSYSTKDGTQTQLPATVITFGAEHCGIDSKTPASSYNSFSLSRFESTSVRKAVLLARYVTCLRRWFTASQSSGHAAKADTGREGEDQPQSSNWRITQLPQFTRYFEEEAELIGDPTLQQEVAILHKLQQEFTSQHSTYEDLMSRYMAELVAAASLPLPDDDDEL